MAGRRRRRRLRLPLLPPQRRLPWLEADLFVPCTTVNDTELFLDYHITLRSTDAARLSELGSIMYITCKPISFIHALLHIYHLDNSAQLSLLCHSLTRLQLKSGLFPSKSCTLFRNQMSGCLHWPLACARLACGSADLSRDGYILSCNAISWLSSNPKGAEPSIPS